MNAKGPRICCARLSQEFDRLIQMPEKEMALTQRTIIVGNSRVMWIELDRFLDIGDCFLWLPHLYQGQSNIAKCHRIISIERNPCFQLNLRFGQSVLNSTEDPHSYVRSRIVRITLENFAEHFSTCA